MIPTVACLECPTYLRERWRGDATAPGIITLVVEWARRVVSGELVWR